MIFPGVLFNLKLQVHIQHGISVLSNNSCNSFYCKWFRCWCLEGKKRETIIIAREIHPQEENANLQVLYFRSTTRKENFWKEKRKEKENVVERLKNVSEHVNKCEEAIPRQDEDKERNLERVMETWGWLYDNEILSKGNDQPGPRIGC